jgi:pilus assembly protein CpaC
MSNRFRFTAALVVLAAAFAASAAAQDAQRRVISIEMNRGQLIRVDTPVKTVFVANPDIADVQVKSPKIVYVMGKKPGETTLIAVDEADRVLIHAGVTVNHNLSRLRRAIDAVMPGNRIQIRSVDGAIVLSGSAASPIDAANAIDIAARFVDRKENVVNQIQVIGPNQVNLRVKVVEISRETIQQLGINWDVAVRSGTLAFGLATGAPTTLLQGNTQIFNLRRTVTGGRTVNNIYGQNNGGDVTVSALVDLLEANGHIKILAQPTLSAMSGKSAHFLAGGEFPIPVPQADGVISIEFKKFGVSLSFTPVIQSGNRITMRVAPEVSQLSNNGAIQIQNFQIPAIVTRKAETMVEVASGQTFVIGGLLQNNITRDINKIPWLSDIPVLGKLFTSERFQRNETELIIMVTPYIVDGVRDLAPAPAGAEGDKPTPPQAKATPEAPANLKASTGKSGPRRLVGGAGFQLD